MTKLFIYSLNDLFLNFWYFFIHKFNCFPQSKILCVFECSFCSFTVHVCLYVSVTYLYVCLHIPLYFLCACCLFVQHLLVCLCVRLCGFVLAISCGYLSVNCQTTTELQQSQTVFKFSFKSRKCSTRCFL